MSEHTLLGAAVAVALILAAPAPTLAHGGEDHGAPQAPAAAPLPPSSDLTSFGAEGGQFQAVLVPSADGRTLLYLAEADTNAPVTGATVEADAAGWSGQAQPQAAEGIYALDWAPGPEPVDVTLIVTAGGRDDLLLVQAVVRRPAATLAAPEPVRHWTHWGGGIGIGVLATALMLILARRRGGAAAAAGLMLLLGGNAALAHSGHDHGPPQPAAAAPQPGVPVVMSKAGQFLLGVRTTRIEPAQAADTVRVVGRVVPDPSGYARIQPSQPARVLADPAFPIPVPGQRVRRGQVLAVLEPTLSTLEKGGQRSSLYRVESEISIAERELYRLETLGALVPAKQVETARIRLDQLRKERGQIAGTSLGRELLVAPVDGLVTDVHVVPGEVVSPTQALVELVDPARLRVEAVVHDLSAASRISGATAATRQVPDQAFVLSLLGVSPRVDPLDQGVHAVFQVAAEQAPLLRLGMPVDVFLATGATSLRTAVPRDALAEVGGRQVVFVRTAPEAFEARPVKVLRVVGPLAEVDGVQPGDRVVTQGIGQLAAVR